MVNCNSLIYSINNSNIEFYSHALTKLGCHFSCVSSNTDFEYLCKGKFFDLIILDLDLDNTDAISVVKEIHLHEKTKKPVVVVCSSKFDDFILVSSLNSGADNFITLPINPVVFELKLKAL